MPVVYWALALISFSAGVQCKCEFDLQDGVRNSTYVDQSENNTIPGEQCVKIVRNNQSSIFILNIINNDQSEQSTLTIRWDGKQENVVTTYRGIVKFINSSQVDICCRLSGRCSSNFTVFYKELERGNITQTLNEEEGSIKSIPLDDCKNETRYRPNAISFWGIKVKNGSVMLTVEKLDLDDYAGDYLLIGSSNTSYGNTSDVFQGPPPLFLTGKSNKEKKIIVSTSYQSQVYIVLVSKTPKREDALGFRIRYKANSERIGVASTEKPAPTIAESWKEAVSICATVPVPLPENETDETVSSKLKSFVRIQAFEKIRRDSNSKPIAQSQIEVVILSQQLRQGEYFALLTIENKDLPNVPLLNAKQLREMFKATEYEPGYKILLCDNRPVDGEWLKAVTLAFVPLFFFLLLLLWWLRYKFFWLSRVKNDENKPTLQVEMYPPIMVNPAFEPDSPLPDEKPEIPSPCFKRNIQKKAFLFDEDSGFVSCPTPPSLAKSTPGMTKRKVEFDVAFDEVEEDKVNQNLEKSENETIHL